MKNLNEKEVLSYIKKNWLTKSIQQLALDLGISETSVARRRIKLGLPKKTVLQKTIKKSSPEPLKDKVYLAIKGAKKNLSVDELANRFDVSPKKINEAIEELKKEHKKFHIKDGNVELQRTLQSGGRTKLDDYHFNGEWIKFGFITDNHLGSRYERLDVLNTAFDVFEQEGIKNVYHAGNMIDGEARFNKFDLHKYGIENQVNYFVDVWPRKKGIKTYFITGDDHEGWYTQREGIDVGLMIQGHALNKGRDDLIYVGHMEHDVVVKMPQGEMVIRIVHPGGGSSYAVSYAPQKIVESYSAGEKPQIILIGHYHKASYNYYRGVHIIQGGCGQDQTPFMRKQKIQAHVGFWIIEVKIGANGVVQRIKKEFFPFYDKEYYDKKWEYKW